MALHGGLLGRGVGDAAPYEVLLFIVRAEEEKGDGGRRLLLWGQCSFRLPVSRAVPAAGEIRPYC